DRLAQICGARRSAGSTLAADGPLDHFHVAIPPFLDAFIQVDEALAQLRVLRIATVHVDEKVLDLRHRFDRRGHVSRESGLWHRVPLAREVMKKRVPQSRRAESAL